MYNIMQFCLFNHNKELKKNYCRLFIEIPMIDAILYNSSREAIERFIFSDCNLICLDKKCE